MDHPYSVEDTLTVMSTIFNHFAKNPEYLKSQGIVRLAGKEGTPIGSFPKAIIDDIFAFRPIEDPTRNEHDFITAMKYPLRNNTFIDKDDAAVQKLLANLNNFDEDTTRQNPIEVFIEDLIASGDLSKIHLAEIIYNYVLFSQKVAKQAKTNLMSATNVAIAGLGPLLANNVVQPSGMSAISVGKKCQDAAQHAISSNHFKKSFREKYSKQLDAVRYDFHLESETIKNNMQIDKLKGLIKDQENEVDKLKRNTQLAVKKYQSNKKAYLPNKFNTAKKEKKVQETLLNISLSKLNELNKELAEAERKQNNLGVISKLNKAPKAKANLTPYKNLKHKKEKPDYYVKQLQDQISALNNFHGLDTHSKSVIKHHLDRIVSARQNLNSAQPEVVENKISVLLDEIANTMDFINKKGSTNSLGPIIQLLNGLQAVVQPSKAIISKQDIDNLKANNLHLKSLKNLDTHSKSIITRSMENIVKAIENLRSGKPGDLENNLKTLHTEIDNAQSLLNKRLDKVSDLQNTITLLDNIKKQTQLNIEPQSKVKRLKK